MVFVDIFPQLMHQGLFPFFWGKKQPSRSGIQEPRRTERCRDISELLSYRVAAGVSQAVLGCRRAMIPSIAGTIINHPARRKVWSKPIRIAWGATVPIFMESEPMKLNTERVKIVPMMGSPVVTPVLRDKASSPEAMPSRCTGTEPMTAVLFAA